MCVCVCVWCNKRRGHTGCSTTQRRFSQASLFCMVMHRFLLFVALSLLCVWKFCNVEAAPQEVVEAQELTAYVTFDGDRQHWYTRQGIHKDGVAWATFLDQINSTGWSQLTVTASPSFDDVAQGYAMGFLEGTLTAQRIYQAYLNYVATMPANTPQILKFCNDQVQTLWPAIPLFLTYRSPSPLQCSYLGWLHRSKQPRRKTVPTTTGNKWQYH